MSDIDMMAGHDYVSTACWHALHEQCRGTCKFCNAACRCPCHEVHPPGTMGDLIEQSSFGGPENQALRARTPRAVSDAITAALRDLREDEPL